MIQRNASCDPAVHELCMRLARSFTDIIKPLLRPGGIAANASERHTSRPAKSSTSRKATPEV